MKLIFEIYDLIIMEAEIDSLGLISLNEKFLADYLEKIYLPKIHQYSDDRIIISDELIKREINNILILYLIQ